MQTRDKNVPNPEDKTCTLYSLQIKLPEGWVYVLYSGKAVMFHTQGERTQLRNALRKCKDVAAVRKYINSKVWQEYNAEVVDDILKRSILG